MSSLYQLNRPSPRLATPPMRMALGHRPTWMRPPLVLHSKKRCAVPRWMISVSLVYESSWQAQLADARLGAGLCPRE